MIYAPIPIYGRLPLVKLTLERLIRQGITPIGVGHEREARKLCRELGVKFVRHENEPLGMKWNAGFMACNQSDCEAVLFVGSSDWVSDKYIDLLRKNINKHEIIGVAGCHFVDVGREIRLVHWRGYTDEIRKGEPIGIGRLLSVDFLKRIEWLPFNYNLNSSLDRSMYQKATNVHLIKNTEEIQCLSISTNKWVNKHKFEDHWSGRLISDRCDVELLNKNFKEIYEI